MSFIKTMDWISAEVINMAPSFFIFSNPFFILFNVRSGLTHSTSDNRNRTRIPVYFNVQFENSGHITFGTNQYSLAEYRATVTKEGANF